MFKMRVPLDAVGWGHLLSTKVEPSSLADLRGAPGTRAPPGGPNSFIFMQFLAKKLQNNSSFGSWRPLLGEILDPPLLL